MLMTCATGADRARRSIRGVFGLYMAMVGFSRGTPSLEQWVCFLELYIVGFHGALQTWGGDIGLLSPELR